MIANLPVDKIDTIDDTIVKILSIDQLSVEKIYTIKELVADKAKTYWQTYWPIDPTNELVGKVDSTTILFLNEDYYKVDRALDYS